MISKKFGQKWLFKKSKSVRKNSVKNGYLKSRILELTRTKNCNTFILQGTQMSFINLKPRSRIFCDTITIEIFTQKLLLISVSNDSYEKFVIIHNFCVSINNSYCFMENYKFHILLIVHLSIKSYND